MPDGIARRRRRSGVPQARELAQSVEPERSAERDRDRRQRQADQLREERPDHARLLVEREPLRIVSGAGEVPPQRDGERVELGRRVRRRGLFIGDLFIGGALRLAHERFTHARIHPEPLRELQRVGVQRESDQEREDPQHPLDAAPIPTGHSFHLVVVPLLGVPPERDRVALRIVQQRRQRLLYALARDLLDRLVDLPQRFLDVSVLRDRDGLLLESEQRCHERARRDVRGEVRLPARLRPPSLVERRRRGGSRLVLGIEHRLDERMGFQPLERQRPLGRILEQLPQALLEVLRSPAGERGDRLVDAGANDGEDEVQEDQADGDIERGEVHHRAGRVTIGALWQVIPASSMAAPERGSLVAMMALRRGADMRRWRRSAA